MLQNSTILDAATKAEPRSKKNIENIVKKLKEDCKISSAKEVDILRILDLLTIKYDYDYEVVTDEKLNKSIYAETDLINKKIYIKESVYEQACLENPRDRFTIAHEIGHLVLHTERIILCRGEEIKKYESPEWQANVFAAEFLAPKSEIKNLTEEEIAKTYKVSRSVARIQLKESKKGSFF